MGLAEYTVPRRATGGGLTQQLVLVDELNRYRPTRVEGASGFPVRVLVSGGDPIRSYDFTDRRAYNLTGGKPRYTNWVYLIPGVVTLPVANPAAPESSSWLSELRELLSGVAEASAASTAPPSTVGRQIAEIQRITGWTDDRLAEAFPQAVARETINRWRNRANPNLREDNLYRLGVLHQLAQRLEVAGIDAPVWLNQPSEGGETPYALICAGRLAEVRQAIELVAAGAACGDAPMVAVTVSREHDVVADDDGDDEDIWGFADPEEELDE